MNCEDVQSKIPLLCGSDLPPEENQELLFDHINRCESCQGTLMEYQESREVLHHLKDECMSEDDWKLFQQDLDAKLAELPSPSRESAPTKDRGESFTHTTSSLRTALVSAAMLLVGLGLGYFGKPFISEYGSDQPPPTESVTPNSSTPSDHKADDFTPKNSRSIENRKETQSVQNGQKQSQQNDFNQEKPILSDPIRDLQQDVRQENRSSD